MPLNLPKPIYSGEDEELAGTSYSKGPRIIGADAIDQSQVVLKHSGPPPYGSRTGWRPRNPEDYGDGGAFPEINIAQYPLDMGRKAASTSNALTLRVDAEGKVDYNAIARRGHGDKRVIHSEFKDLIPLRQRADAGELSLDRPSEEEVAETRERTQAALTTLINGAVAAQKPKNVQGLTRAAPQYVSYTPDAQMGSREAGQRRIIKIVQKHIDPVEPPKHKHKKIPRGPPSPPAPVMHSPPRKLTAEDQEAWKIPPPISNWKNPKGYTVPLDKRLAADGRGLQDVTINDKFAQFAESMAAAERLSREEIKQRALMQQRLAEKEKNQKAEELRVLARRARQNQSGGLSSRYSESRSPTPDDRRSRSRSRTRSATPSRRHQDNPSRTPPRRSRSRSAEDSAAAQRAKARRERKEENERSLRQSRMGTERKLAQLAREQGRDISEKVALGVAKPTSGGEAMYDARLFNQTSGFGRPEYNEDQHFDRPLFANRDALNSIYRPGGDVEDEEDAEKTVEGIQKGGRFEVLGRAERGFKGSEFAERREGPVQFERDARKDKVGAASGGKGEDLFGIDEFINEVKSGVSGEKGTKRYGMQEAEAEGRRSKRARVDDADND